MVFKVAGTTAIDSSRNYNVTGLGIGSDIQTTAYTLNNISTKTPSQLLWALNSPDTDTTEAYDQFGGSVAISGNYAIVGAYQEDEFGFSSSGKAYIFNVTTGRLVHTLNNPNAYSTTNQDQFGYSVGISNNYAIVSAYQEDDAGGANSGKVYIFNVTTGQLLWTLNNPNAYSTNEYDQFGGSVAISGNYAIVGAYQEDDSGGTSSGKAYIYNVTTGQLLWTLNDPNAYSTSSGDNFGQSVAISGNYAIVGVPSEDDASGTNSGKAYIFNVTTGQLLWTLNNPNDYSTSTVDYFGNSVAISGNCAIVGAYGEDSVSGVEVGRAYIYNVTTGQLLWTLNNPNQYSNIAYDQFGYSVAMSGNYAIVGAYGGDDAGGMYSGRVCIYNVTTGQLLWTLNNPNAYSTSEFDYFGKSVGITGNYIIVGASGEDSSSSEDSGKAYIFNIGTVNSLAGISDVKFANGASLAGLNELLQPCYVGGQLTHILNNPMAYSYNNGDNFGYSVAISGNYAIVATPEEDDASGTSSGKAYIFNVTTGQLLFVLNNPNAYSNSWLDVFGTSVSISGNYAIVGAWKESDAGGSLSGKAYIFNVTTGTLLWTLDNPNAYSTGANDYFGRAVAISGNYAIVSAYWEDDAGNTNSGKAYIYNVTTGALLWTLNNPNAYDTSAYDNFGWSVAISGNYAIVSAYIEDDAGGNESGKAYIFNVTNGQLLWTLDNPNSYSTSAYDYFGYSVAISGNYTIVGAYNEDDAGGTDSGKAYIFNVTNGQLLWTLDNPNSYSTSAGDQFGYSVAISGNYAIVGVPYEDDAGGEISGKAYIFNVTTGQLIHTLNDPNSYSTSANDGFGRSVAISGNYAVAGASGESDSTLLGSQAGKAYIFSVTNQTYADKLMTMLEN
jgi:outer membrane protein assembly factor BamB